MAEHALRCACVAGALACPLAEPAAGLPELQRAPLLAHARACLYRAAFLRSLRRRGADSIEGDADDGPAVGAAVDADGASVVVGDESDRPVADAPVEADGASLAVRTDETEKLEVEAEALLAQEAARVLHDHAVFATLHRGYAFVSDFIRRNTDD